jgi:hypothetical protein
MTKEWNSDRARALVVHCEEFGVKVPKYVADVINASDERAAACKAALAAIDAEVAPPNILGDPKDLPKLIDARVAYETRDVRRVYVKGLLGRADDAANAWGPGDLIELLDTFKPVYAEAAEQFKAAVASAGDGVEATLAQPLAPGYAALSIAAGKLSRLAVIRDLLQIRHPAGDEDANHGREILRLITPASKDALSKARSYTKRDRLTHGAPAFWVLLAGIDGVTFSWNTHEDIERIVDAILRGNAEVLAPLDHLTEQGAERRAALRLI